MGGKTFLQEKGAAYPPAPHLAMVRYLDLLYVRQLFSCAHKQQFPQETGMLLAVEEIKSMS